jgi:hypothetical protein
MPNRAQPSNNRIRIARRLTLPDHLGLRRLAPKLLIEADNHLIELAVAGGAAFIVTRNLRDFARGELQFPRLRVVDPLTFLKELEPWPH